MSSGTPQTTTFTDEMNMMNTLVEKLNIVRANHDREILACVWVCGKREVDRNTRMRFYRYLITCYDTAPMPDALYGKNPRVLAESLDPQTFAEAARIPVDADIGGSFIPPFMQEVFQGNPDSWKVARDDLGQLLGSI